MKFHIPARLLTVALAFQFAAFVSRAAEPADTGPDAIDHSRYIFMPPIDDDGKTSGFHAVTVCLPAGYASTDRRYPVLYLMDGESCFLTTANGLGDTIGYDMAHDQLVHDGLIQPAILVAVHNGSDARGMNILPSHRAMDYFPPLKSANFRGLGQGYFEFLTTKVKPMIDRMYRTRPEPASTGVAGFSAGGMAAFWMTYLHPEVFGMGLCQSPAVGPANEFLDEHHGPIPPVRLWIDAGSLESENGLLKVAFDVSRKLLSQGFRQNDNLAFQVGHLHGHEKFDCTRRLRAALYFMLRSKPPAYTGAQLVDANSSVDDSITLNHLGLATLELQYDHGFRLTDCSATLKISDPSIATLSAPVSALLPLAPGETTLVATRDDGQEISQKVVVPIPPAPLRCPETTRPVVIDGDLSEWPELQFSVDGRNSEPSPSWTGPSDLSYRFACAHDERFLYIAVQTTDDIMKSQPDKAPWAQDGIEVRIDARPSAERLFYRSKRESDDILLVAMSPALGAETQPPFNAEKLPEGTKAVCKATATGYNTEIAIPVGYLDMKAGKPWTDVRVNIVVNDFDDDYKGFKGDKFWWQPDWRRPASVWGSGTFVR